ncbi:hypothetical protein [Bdellovibrio sp. HCB337]|uniref:hypothetical protein n=1 Tax=Bdellovibrio sp. HCB337 TaxID=3394358 RepID=UPI0039A6A1B4
MNALNRSSQIFMKLLAFNGSVLFAMTLQRLVLFLVVVRHWLFGADGVTIASSFVMGLRFDLCVLGFINIPLLFVTWAICSDYFVNSQNKFVQFFRKWSLGIYLAITTFVIHLLGMLDLMYFAGNGRRWTYYDWQKSGLDFVSQISEKWGFVFTTGVVVLFIFLWAFRCMVQLYRAELQKTPLQSERLAQSKVLLILLGVVLPFFVVALAARGTWTAHHINAEHAEVSQNPALNQLTLSPVWAFDKKF